MGSNVEIKQADKLKKHSVFIAPNGQKYEGGAEEYFGNQMGNKLGGAERPNNFGKASKN